jgi:hypothetical protein
MSNVPEDLRERRPCPACGEAIVATARKCRFCGEIFDPALRPDDPGDDAALRFVLPVGRSGWAIAAGYLGLLSVLGFPGPFALLAGILAIREMRKNPKKHGMGRAVFGIVMGAIGTVILPFLVMSLVVGRR